MINTAIKYFIIDVCISNLFSLIENNLVNPPKPEFQYITIVNAGHIVRAGTTKVYCPTEEVFSTFQNGPRGKLRIDSNGNHRAVRREI